MYGRHAAADPSLVEPLEDRGLLRLFQPNDWVDSEMTTQLAELMVELLTNGALDDLDRDLGLHELSRSRMSYRADVGLACLWRSFSPKDSPALRRTVCRYHCIPPCARPSS